MQQIMAVFLAAFISLPISAFAADPASRSENLQTTVTFYEQFFNQHDISAADRYIGDVYVQHNPNVPDGRQALIDGFTRVFARFPQRHSEIVRAVADGDLVVLHVHLTTSAEDRGVAVVDIFRLDHGRIVEHWDVQQSVPEASANQNTMF